MSGSVFALSLDPCLRCMLRKTTLQSAGRCGYAGDLRAEDLYSQIPIIVAALERWRHASGVRLRTFKCVAISFWNGSVAEAARWFEGEGDLSGLRLSRSATYLGIQVCPGWPPTSGWGWRRKSVAKPKTWRQSALLSAIGIIQHPCLYFDTIRLPMCPAKPK